MLVRDGSSPDESLTADDGFLPVDEHGLSYPFGGAVPEAGEVREIAPGVHWTRLKLFVSLNHINLWLIDDGDGVAVVDTGMRQRESFTTWDALLAGPLAGKPITRMFATHYHPDHVGMAGWLGERTGARLWMTREEWLTARMVTAPSGSGVVADAFQRRWRYAGWDDAVIAEMQRDVRPDLSGIVTPLGADFVRVRDGDRLDIGGAEWQVVVGRGHSPEHCCLWNKAAGLLISGDQILPRISPNISVLTSEPEGDPLADWLASIERFLELPEDTLVLPAHGEPFYGMHARLRRMRDQHLERLDVLADFIRTPRRVVDCFETLFRRGPEAFDGFNRELAVGETLAHLRRLIGAGRADVSERDGIGWFSASSQ